MRQHRTWVEISASALRHNYRAIKKFVSPVPVGLVIKSNAYGHGTAAVLEATRELPIWGYCVAYGAEALALREQGWRGKILVMSFWQDNELPELLKKNVDLVAWNLCSAHDLAKVAQRLNKNVSVHLKIDSGTSRLGLWPTELPSALAFLRRTPRLRLIGVFSHLANSEEASRTRTKKQINRFTTLSHPWANHRGITRHLACTAAALRFPEARFGLLRLGIGLYGLWPSDATKREIGPKILLHPALVWKAQISQVKQIPAGTQVGYGGTWRARRSTVIATVPVGYADGYQRAWSNTTWAMVHGRRAPIIGRVSMNILTIDVNRISEVKPGDVVTLLGPGITAEDLAAASPGMIPYEVVTAIHPDIPRLVISR